MTYKNRIVGHGEEPLDGILFNPSNWRIHPKGQQEALDGVLSEVGWVQDVIVNKRTGNLIDGHLRCKLAASKGETTIPVVYVDLDENEERLVLASLDPLAAMAATDKPKLDELIKSIQSDNPQIQRMMDEIAQENGVSHPVVDDAEPQLDKADELRAQWGVETGNLWAVGQHKILCGDCTKPEDVQRLMGGEKADMVTDPPYGMDLDTDWSDLHGLLTSTSRANQTKGNKYDKVIGDGEPFDPLPLFELFQLGEMFLFGADYYCDKIPHRELGSWLVWDKRKESQSEAIGAEFELIWSKNKHKRRMLRFDWFGFLSSSAPKEARDRVHPTQKPTTLIDFIIKEWCKNDLIADPFAGSGTTMVACQNLSRKCRAIEISPAYCAVVLQRMKDAFPDISITKE